MDRNELFYLNETAQNLNQTGMIHHSSHLQGLQVEMADGIPFKILTGVHI